MENCIRASIFPLDHALPSPLPPLALLLIRRLDFALIRDKIVKFS